jgi:hypothetical protein
MELVSSVEAVTGPMSASTSTVAESPVSQDALKAEVESVDAEVLEVMD